jgi:ribosome modulation factor
MEFEDFYSQFPKKASRKTAQNAWNKLNKKQKQKALEAIQTHIYYWQQTGRSKEFIPYPATWLNAHSFDDEIEMPDNKPKETDYQKKMRELTENFAPRKEKLDAPF